MSNQRSPSVHLARRFALSATVAFVALYATLHVLRPDYDPIRQHSSALVLGPYGWMMTAALVVVAAGALALAWALRHHLPRSLPSSLGIRLLEGFGVLILLSGVFPMDPPGAELSVTGAIHAIGSMTGFALMIGAMLVLGLAFRRDLKWSTHGTYSAGLGAVGLVVFVLMVVDPPLPIGGLLQRVLIGILVLWFGAILIRLNASSLRSRS